MESNHRPHAYQACALTIWAMSPYYIGVRVHFQPLEYALLSTLKTKQWAELILLLIRFKIKKNYAP